jgi:hypothetical protein
VGMRTEAADGGAPGNLARDSGRRIYTRFLLWPLDVLDRSGTSLTEAALFVVIMSVTLAMVCS